MTITTRAQPHAAHTPNQKETAMTKLHQVFVSYLRAEVDTLVSYLRDAADDNDIVALHNEYASADDYVYTSIEDIADVIATDDPTSLAYMVFFGDVESWYDRYFSLDGYGNINSFSSLTDAFSPVDFDLLAKQIIEHEQYDDVNFDVDPYLSDDDE